MQVNAAEANHEASTATLLELHQLCLDQQAQLASHPSRRIGTCAATCTASMPATPASSRQPPNGHATENDENSPPVPEPGGPGLQTAGQYRDMATKCLRQAHSLPPKGLPSQKEQRGVSSSGPTLPSRDQGQGPAHAKQAAHPIQSLAEGPEAMSECHERGYSGLTSAPATAPRAVAASPRCPKEMSFGTPAAAAAAAVPESACCPQQGVPEQLEEHAVAAGMSGDRMHELSFIPQAEAQEAAAGPPIRTSSQKPLVKHCTSKCVHPRHMNDKLCATRRGFLVKLRPCLLVKSHARQPLANSANSASSISAPFYTASVGLQQTEVPREAEVLPGPQDEPAELVVHQGPACSSQPAPVQCSGGQPEIKGPTGACLAALPCMQAAGEAGVLTPEAAQLHQAGSPGTHHDGDASPGHESLRGFCQPDAASVASKDQVSDRAARLAELASPAASQTGTARSSGVPRLQHSWSRPSNGHSASTSTGPEKDQAATAQQPQQPGAGPRPLLQHEHECRAGRVSATQALQDDLARLLWLVMQQEAQILWSYLGKDLQPPAYGASEAQAASTQNTLYSERLPALPSGQVQQGTGLAMTGDPARKPESGPATADMLQSSSQTAANTCMEHPPAGLPASSEPSMNIIGCTLAKGPSRQLQCNEAWQTLCSPASSNGTGSDPVCTSSTSVGVQTDAVPEARCYSSACTTTGASRMQAVSEATVLREEGQQADDHQGPQWQQDVTNSGSHENPSASLESNKRARPREEMQSPNVMQGGPQPNIAQECQVTHEQALRSSQLGCPSKHQQQQQQQDDPRAELHAEGQAPGDWRQQLSDQQQEHDTIVQQLQQKEMQLMAEVQARSKLADDLQRQMDSQQQDLESLKQQHQQQLRELMAQVGTNKQLAEDLQQAISCQQQEHDCAMQRQKQMHADQLEVELYQEQQMITNLQQQVADAESRMTESMQLQDGLQKQNCSLIKDKEDLAHQNERLVKQLAGQAADLRTEQARSAALGQSVADTKARLEATVSTGADVQAALRKLQELGQLHARQALHDLQRLCQYIGELEFKCIHVSTGSLQGHVLGIWILIHRKALNTLQFRAIADP